MAEIEQLRNRFEQITAGDEYQQLQDGFPDFLQEVAGVLEDALSCADALKAYVGANSEDLKARLDAAVESLEKYGAELYNVKQAYEIELYDHAQKEAELKELNYYLTQARTDRDKALARIDNMRNAEADSVLESSRKAYEAYLKYYYEQFDGEKHLREDLERENEQLGTERDYAYHELYRLKNEFEYDKFNAEYEFYEKLDAELARLDELYDRLNIKQQELDQANDRNEYLESYLRQSDGDHLVSTQEYEEIQRLLTEADARAYQAEMEAENARILAETAELQQQAAERYLYDANSELYRIKNEHEDENSNTAALQRELDYLHDDYTAKEDELERAYDDLADAKAELNRTKQELQEKNQILADAEQELDSLHYQLEARESLTDAHDLENQLEDMYNALTRLEDENDTITRALYTEKARSEALVASVRETQQHYRETDAMLADRAAESDRLYTALRTAQEELADARDYIDELQRALSAAESAPANNYADDNAETALQHRLEALEGEKAELESELRQLRAVYVHELADTKKAYQEYVTALLEQFSRISSHIRETFAYIADADDALESVHYKTLTTAEAIEAAYQSLSAGRAAANSEIAHLHNIISIQKRQHEAFEQLQDPEQINMRVDAQMRECTAQTREMLYAVRDMHQEVGMCVQDMRYRAYQQIAQDRAAARSAYLSTAEAAQMAAEATYRECEVLRAKITAQNLILRRYADYNEYTVALVHQLYCSAIRGAGGEFGGCMRFAYLNSPAATNDYLCYKVSGIQDSVKQLSEDFERSYNECFMEKYHLAAALEQEYQKTRALQQQNENLKESTRNTISTIGEKMKMLNSVIARMREKEPQRTSAVIEAKNVLESKMQLVNKYETALAARNSDVYFLKQKVKQLIADKSRLSAQ